MKKLLLLPFLFISMLSFSQTLDDINVVPQPAEIRMGKGFCVLKEPIGFILIDLEDNYEHDNPNDGEELFKKYLKKNYKLTKFVK